MSILSEPTTHKKTHTARPYKACLINVQRWIIHPTLVTFCLWVELASGWRTLIGRGVLALTWSAILRDTKHADEMQYTLGFAAEDRSHQTDSRNTTELGKTDWLQWSSTICDSHRWGSGLNARNEKKRRQWECFSTPWTSSQKLNVSVQVSRRQNLLSKYIKTGKCAVLKVRFQSVFYKCDHLLIQTYANSAFLEYLTNGNIAPITKQTFKSRV